MTLDSNTIREVAIGGLLLMIALLVSVQRFFSTPSATGTRRIVPLLREYRLANGRPSGATVKEKLSRQPEDKTIDKKLPFNLYTEKFAHAKNELETKRSLDVVADSVSAAFVGLLEAASAPARVLVPRGRNDWLPRGADQIRAFMRRHPARVGLAGAIAGFLVGLLISLAIAAESLYVCTELT